jgi:hypothetical protein
VMNDVPTSVSDVQRIRNAGWPTGGDAYGHGILVVVVGVTPHQGERESRSQGEAGEAVSPVGTQSRYAKCG